MTTYVRTAAEVRADLADAQAKLAAADEAREQSRARFAEAVKQAAATPGWSYATVGAVLGLSKQRVGEIIKTAG